MTSQSRQDQPLAVFAVPSPAEARQILADGEEPRPFEIISPYQPAGDQPEAIDALVKGLNAGLPHQTLLGVTGSGKTFTMASVIARVQRPALILAHNKTLAAQLYREFKELFPHNAVEYFVSYYDYYQPEAYVPSTDTFIEKDSSINDELDKMRLAATKHLLERRDVIIVSSVSCIYGIGSPTDYNSLRVFVEEGMKDTRKEFLHRLVAIQYKRGDGDFHRGTFRVRGDVVDVYPAYEEAKAIRVEFFGNQVDRIEEIHPFTGVRLRRLKRAVIYPGSHHVTSRPKLEAAMKTIEAELDLRLMELKEQGRLVELMRLEQRTRNDLDMMRETGSCAGIENYSRHMTGRLPGQPPYTLIDYFPEDFLLFVDESHVTLPQIRGMFEGDRSRKTVLVEYGFRLPSALDNRPLRGEEFDQRIHQAVYVSATPSEEELRRSEGLIVEQVIRPTGLVDPPIEVKPARGQVEDAVAEIRQCVDKGDRVLVTCLTKRSSEDLAEYCAEIGIRAKYLHSDIDAIQRTEIIRELRLGKFDVLIGVNLLREGLDIPEVSLVLILDADKEGFLRGKTALIQTCGRAARNADGRVILYADRMTEAITATLEETERRRTKQLAYNEKHGIIPRSISKKVQHILDVVADGELVQSDNGMMMAAEDSVHYQSMPSREELPSRIEQLRKQMREAAMALEFEKAAKLRDEMTRLQKILVLDPEGLESLYRLSPGTHGVTPEKENSGKQGRSISGKKGKSGSGTSRRRPQ
jgi:excinuclease ABC subunit B